MLLNIIGMSDTISNYVLFIYMCDTISDYVALFWFYSKTIFMWTCSNIVFPTIGPQLWPLDNHNTVALPVIKRVIGQSKKQINKANDEPKILIYCP